MLYSIKDKSLKQSAFQTISFKNYRRRRRMEVLKCLIPLLIQLPATVKATSFKMDFLSAGVVRTDPLMFPQIGECLSDHMHR